MKALQKYILSLLMIVSTVSMCAMDGREHQTLSLNSIAIKQIVAEELEQISTKQNKELHKKKIVPVLQQLERRARWKRNKNLTSLVMDQPWCTNNVLEMLVGSSGHAQDKKPYFVFLIDRKVRPWMLIDQQRSAILKSIKPGDFEDFKKAYGLLDVYTLLFISPKAPIDLRLKKASDFAWQLRRDKSHRQESSDFIKNYKNEHGVTLLHKAGSNGNIEVVRLLLDRGANVDTPDNYGWTPLCISAWNEKVEVVRLLLDRGANVDAPNNYGWTPLHISAWNGKVEVVRLLLDRGANVDTLNNYGRTPLHISALTGNVEVVRLLLDRGVNVDTPDNYGQTPEQTTSNPEIKDLFAQARIDRAKKVALENQNKKDS